VNRRMILLASAVLALAAPLAARAQPGPIRMRHRWVYLSTNLLVAKNVEGAVALLERAARDGYTGIVLADSKFMRWDDLPERYLANVRTVRDACRTLRLDCIACVMPIGYSESLLARDPNLAEGLPVRDAPLVVRGGRFVPADEPSPLANGSFESSKGDMPAGWQFADMPGKITFIDHAVKCDGQVSLRMQDIGTLSPQHGHGRVMQVLKVQLFRYYHVSVSVKTEGFEATDGIGIPVLAEGDARLAYYEPKVLPTQDWTRLDMTFNSLDFQEVRLYLGVWGGKGGTIWWDDVRIEPAGLTNAVRRDGAPLRATSADSKTVYAEGRDFAGAADPLLGNSGYRGNFDFWHTPPVITVPPGSRLKEGQTVLLSYYHTALIGRGQVMCCMSEPKVYDILAWQAREVHRNLQPDGYFMQHDEIRVQGWDESCMKRKLAPGRILADNVRRCTEILHKEDPGKPVYVWSDMFDPYHNARKGGRYYLVRGEGPWYGSWEGLPEDVIVVNWHGHKEGRLESLEHFAGLGHMQILAGYYDGPPGRIADWLADASKTHGIVGVMYTTWQHRYDDLETFAAEVGKYAN